MEQQLAKLQEGLQATVRRLDELESAQKAAEAAMHGQLGMLEADQGDLQSQGATFGMRIEALEKGQTSHAADIKDLQKRLRREENRLNEIAQFVSVVQEDKVSRLEEKFDEMQLWMDGKGSSFPAPLVPAVAPEPVEGGPAPEQEGRFVAIEQRIVEINEWIAEAQEQHRASTLPVRLDCGGPANVPPLGLTQLVSDPDAAALQQQKMTALERRVDELHSWIATQNRVATPRQGPATPRHATPRQGPATPRQTQGAPRISPRDAGKPVLTKLPLGNLVAVRELSPLQEAEREADEGQSPSRQPATEPQGEPTDEAEESFASWVWRRLSLGAAEAEATGPDARSSGGAVAGSPAEPNDGDSGRGALAETAEARAARPSAFASCFLRDNGRVRQADGSGTGAAVRAQEQQYVIESLLRDRLAEETFPLSQQILALERRIDRLLDSKDDHDSSSALATPPVGARASRGGVPDSDATAENGENELLRALHRRKQKIDELGGETQSGGSPGLEG